MLEKIILGIFLAAPIGPVSVEMIRRGINGGFMPAFNIRLGGAAGQLLFLIAAYFGISQMQNNPILISALGIAGAGLLIHMGTKALLSKSVSIDLSDNSNTQNGLRWGFYLAIVNPVSIVFWPGIFAASMSPGTQLDLIGLVENLMIIGGVLIWGAGLSLTLAFGHKYLNEKVINYITKGSGLFMIYYGGKYLWTIASVYMLKG